MNKHALCVALLLAVGSTAFGGGQMMAQTSTPPPRANASRESERYGYRP